MSGSSDDSLTKEFVDHPAVPVTLVKDYLYLCSVEELASRSPDHIRIFGTPTVFDKEIDRTLAKGQFITYMSVDTMLEHYINGTVVRVKHRSDCKLIYENVQDYLELWSVALSSVMNMANPPIERLIKLDEFANSVYEHARHDQQKTTFTDILKRSAGPNPYANVGAGFKQGSQTHKALNGESSVDDQDYQTAMRQTFGKQFRGTSWT